MIMVVVMILRFGEIWHGNRSRSRQRTLSKSRRVVFIGILTLTSETTVTSST